MHGFDEFAQAHAKCKYHGIDACKGCFNILLARCITLRLFQSRIGQGHGGGRPRKSAYIIASGQCRLGCCQPNTLARTDDQDFHNDTSSYYGKSGPGMDASRIFGSGWMTPILVSVLLKLV